MVKLRSGLAGRNASSPSIVKVLKLIQVVFSLSTDVLGSHSFEYAIYVNDKINHGKFTG